MKDNFKNLFSSSAVIGACAMMFLVSNNLVLAKAADQTQEIPTEYSAIDSKPDYQVSENYTKPSYTITEGLMGYPIKAETEERLPNALSMEEAAEIGAQYIWDLLGLDLEGMDFNMQYETNGRTKPCWTGFVMDNGDDVIAIFTIDAVTGERISIEHMKAAQNLRKSGDANIINLIKDQKELEDLFRNNCDEHIEAAKAYGEKHFNAKIVDAKFSLAYQVSDGEELAELLEGIEEPEARGAVIDEYHSVDRPTQVVIQISITDETGKQGYVSVFDDANKSLDNIGTTNPSPYIPFEDVGGLG